MTYAEACMAALQLGAVKLVQIMPVFKFTFLCYVKVTYCAHFQLYYIFLGL